MPLTPKGYRPRIVDDRLSLMLRTFGAVYIEGPKYCGKTWSSRNQCNSEIQLDPDTIGVVASDIDVALEGPAPRLIDEWQQIPRLWDDVRFKIDRTGSPGQYILCGSYSLGSDDIRAQIHSGIGRIARVRMHPMSLYESGDSDGNVSLMSMFDGNFTGCTCDRHGLRELIHMTARGGWPAVVYKGMDPVMFNDSYVDILCRSDVFTIDGVRRDERKMRMFLRALARNESTVVKDTTLMRDMKENDDEDISESALADYRTILERLQMLWLQPSFSPNIRSSVKVGKSPKRHLADPSMSMALLGMTEEMAFHDLETYGFMFEAMCERDLMVYAESFCGRLYHYRDHSGREIDAVIEMPDGRWGAFEIKLGFNQVDAAAENLLKVRSMIEEKGGRPPSVLCVIYGVGKYAYRRADGIYVVPITALRP